MKLSIKLRDWTDRWRRGNMMLLGLSLRLVPSENQRVFALALIAGALCGLAAVFFHLSIIATETRVIDRAMHAHGQTWIWWTILIPTAGGLLSGALLKYVVPGARGSGIPQVKVAYSIRDGRVALVDAIGKFVIGVLQIGTGSSLGREGPTVQICAGVSSALGRGAALSRDNHRRQLRSHLAIDDRQLDGLRISSSCASGTDLRGFAFTGQHSPAASPESSVTCFRAVTRSRRNDKRSRSTTVNDNRLRRTENS